MMKTRRSDKCMNTVDLARYLGGRTSAEERERIEGHIAECGDCLEEIAVSNALLRDGDLTGYGPVSEETTAKVLRRMKSRRGKPAENAEIGIVSFFRALYEWIAGLMVVPTPVLLRSPKPGCGDGDCGHRSISFGDDKIRTAVVSEGPDISVTIKRGGESVIRIALENSKGNTDSRPFRGDTEIFENLSHGVYRLSLKKDTLETEDIRFEIDGAGIHEK